jgi:hypothetical protein
MSFVLERSSEAHFNPIDLGRMKVSIQASQFHYSSPRQTLPSSDDYKEFEVALFLNGECFHPKMDDVFCQCDWSNHWSDSDNVAAGVPRADIEQMLTDLRTAFSP